MSYIVLKDKPHYCIDCIFLDSNYRDCKLQKVDYCDFNKQYKNCPLIEIPTPHGRLKDESDIISLIEAMFCEDKDGMECAIQCVKDVDTVIEAEDGT